MERFLKYFLKFKTMKNTILPFLVLFTISISAQNIEKISVFDNTEYSSSGIIGITNSGVYEYSWYFDTWLSFPTEGLTLIDDQPVIKEVSTCNNLSHNPSGIYVISDTSVHVYNYYAEFWYALYNEGLEREDGIIQLSDLSVRYDVEDDYVDIYVRSGDHIYYYDRYFHLWYQLPNDGISTINSPNNEDNNVEIYPNPVSLNSNIVFTLPENYNNYISVAVFSQDGKIVKEFTFDNMTGGEHQIDLNTEEFTDGMYYFEIKGVNFSHVKKFIKLRK